LSGDTHDAHDDQPSNGLAASRNDTGNGPAADIPGARCTPGIGRLCQPASFKGSLMLDARAADDAAERRRPVVVGAH